MLADMRLPTAARGTIARTVAGLGLIAIIFSFLGWSLASGWSELTSEDIDVQPALHAIDPGAIGLIVEGVPSLFRDNFAVFE